MTEKALEKINDDTICEIKREIEIYQRPIISHGNVSKPCSVIKAWENGISHRIYVWVERKKKEIGKVDGDLVYSVGYGLLSRMYEDTEDHLKSVLRKDRH